MTKAPIFIQIEREMKVRRIINSVLLEYGIDLHPEDAELTLRPEVVLEHTGRRTLSNSILDSMFPKALSPCELYHYTTVASLKGIAATRQLRLYWARKRIGEGELDTFAIRHGLKGYLDTSAGEPFYKTLSDDLFYVSLTRPGGGDEIDLWSVFAEGGHGVRLKLRVHPSRAELRAIQYDALPDTVLSKLNSALASEGEPPFVPWSLSKIGAFCLPSTLRREDEVRLLIKRHAGGRDDALTDGINQYWPLPIGESNDFCQIDLIEIHPGPNAQMHNIQNTIAGTPFESVPVV
ncbi:MULTISPECIES: hypothetical protein [Rhizobium]|uniref:hypothetical protein n=1 Tax=Rhizobium TaxID=379 RepID=UPI00103E6AFF|nr:MULTISPECIES: hypothetical protein [Rhizobium]MBY3425265.1 hypothetical protein [Rhizobium laguerreae]MBY5345291.1 hypothetical protein [Rhizobium leguminosarum]MBY5376105.1 hypothetical protein [Rhizobium leguminosarum]MBY5392365.1 hypothetical protein [Rhizobium leguminosarum]MBY5434506.1 hypothetical protein [Rhizobium leguminosarum]